MGIKRRNNTEDISQAMKEGDVHGVPRDPRVALAGRWWTEPNESGTRAERRLAAKDKRLREKHGNAS